MNSRPVLPSIWFVIWSTVMGWACDREIEPRYAGASTCIACHATQVDAWTNSPHDLAMQVADSTTVLGDFGGATFVDVEDTLTFFTVDSTFRLRVATRNATAEYRVAYTFGAHPLQQYLVEAVQGAKQALSVAWDARSVADGGQRWYSLAGNEGIPSGDPRHWQGSMFRWNSQCAACHSTNVEKRYDAVEQSYATTWSDIDVACEACHGPATQHVAWARTGQLGTDRNQPVGLTVDVSDRDMGRWRLLSEHRIAERVPARTSTPELDTCASCHARRELLVDVPTPGQHPLDVFRPTLINDAAYYPDGQIRDEVYVYGSFVQSAMYRSGVTCGDCHDPHSTRLRIEGNRLCTTCHLTTAYDTPEHTHHQMDSPGASCVSCHMPTRTYMGVDDRRDHSFRVPRPDLTDVIGTPNACTMCHQDQNARWATEAVRQWFDSRPRDDASVVFADSRTGRLDVAPALARLAVDTSQSDMVRAAALVSLRRYPGNDAKRAIRIAVVDSSPMVRYGGVLGTEGLAADQRFELLQDLLQDPVRLVRIEAGRVLVGSREAREQVGAMLGAATNEYIATQMVISDRAESHVNVATIHVARGELDRAAAALHVAVEIDSTFVPAYIGLAELRRSMGRDLEGETSLRRAITLAPESADGHHALGLWLVRQRRVEEGVQELRVAAMAAPSNARMSYVYGVALHSTGRVEEAIRFLGEAIQHSPNDPQLLSAIVAFTRDAGRLGEAVRWAEAWRDLNPGDSIVQQVVADLRRLQSSGPAR